jgi:hypothetical protein
MSTTNYSFVKTFENLYPHTNGPFQKLVMSAESVAKNMGKSSIFGKDKGAVAMDKFIEVLFEVRNGLVMDGHLDPNDKNIPEIMNAVMVAKSLFSSAYPNWQIAYQFLDYFNGEARSN